MQPDHVQKRETPRGRWLPIVFYLVNVALWLLAGVSAAAWDRLWLIVLVVPALALYLFRTRRGIQ
jgi:fatty acid desaturase